MSQQTTSVSSKPPGRILGGRRAQRGVYDSDSDEDDSVVATINSSSSSNMNNRSKAPAFHAPRNYKAGDFKYTGSRSGLNSDEDEKDDDKGSIHDGSGAKAERAEVKKIYFDDDDDVESGKVSNSNKPFVPKDITKIVSNNQNVSAAKGGDSWATSGKLSSGSMMRSSEDFSGAKRTSGDEKENSNTITGGNKGWKAATTTNEANNIRQRAIVGDHADAIVDEVSEHDKAGTRDTRKGGAETKPVNILDSSVEPHVPTAQVTANSVASHLLKLSLDNSFIKVAHKRGIRTPLVQCVIIRDKSSMHNRLYPTYELVLQENLKPLILAQKQEMNRMSNYRMYDMTRGVVSTKLSKKSGNYLGKLKSMSSNRTEYVLVGNKEVKEEYAGILFDRMNLLNQLKDGSQPRKMTLLLPKIDPKTQEPLAYQLEKEGADSMSELLKKNTDVILSPNFHLFETKDPIFEGGNYRLNFNGRVSVPSVKNFQLVSLDDNDDIICQFGKVGDDRFHLDYKAPLNAFQAFALALCQFNI